MSAEQHDQHLLTRYLLGTLPDTEAERLDELSVADDEFALHLGEAENDLVDSYVRGELSGETLDRFEAHYLSSERRRAKVMFAEALRRRTEDGRAVSTSLAPRLVPAWALAAAALVLMLPAGYLLVANGRLRQEIKDARTRQASLETRAEGLRKQLEQMRPAEVEAGKAQVGVAPAMIERLKIVSLLLLPQLRGPGRVENLSLPPETDVVALQLQLESDEFPQYEVALKSAADNRVLWRSGKLNSVPADKGKLVTASVPASLLAPGHFSVELAGVGSEKQPQLLASYAFQVVVR